MYVYIYTKIKTTFFPRNISMSLQCNGSNILQKDIKQQ